MGLSLDLKPSNSGDPVTTLKLDHAEISAALQYGATAGYAPLIEWLIEHQRIEHKRCDTDWDITMGAGAGSLINNVFLALLDDGDSIIVPSPSYAFAEAYLRTVELVAGNEQPPRDAAQYLRIHEPLTDGQGLNPDDLRRILETWPPDQPLPKLLYLVPTGNNPTGETIPEDRRRAILTLCHAYDVLIIEDDPYIAAWYSDTPRPRSFFSLEKEVTGSTGLVIRMDSFSKLLGGGLRLAYLTGPRWLTDHVTLLTSNTTLQTSSTSQIIVYKMLSHWGHDGLSRHYRRIADFYRNRRDVAEGAARDILGEVATWVTPQAGFFLFLKLELEDSFELIRNEAFDAGFLAAPGQAFMGPGKKSSCVRISFSLMEEADIREAFTRLRDVCLRLRGRN